MAPDILERIVQAKQAEVTAAQREIPLNRLREAAEARQDVRPFFDALKVPGPSGVNIIAEIKRASPSKGVIRQDLDPGRLAESYAAGGARAISVLTEKRFFLGSADDLKQARLASGLPVLRKDFIFCDYQIYESAAMGADAVLLIVRILDQQRLGGPDPAGLIPEARRPWWKYTPRPTSRPPPAPAPGWSASTTAT